MVTINDYNSPEDAYIISIGAKINDHGWPWTADTHSVAEKMRLSEPTTEIWMKVDPHCQRQKCRPMTLWRYKIYRVYSRRFPGEGVNAVKRQWGNQKRRVSMFSLAIFLNTLEMRPVLLYSDMQSIVGFSVIPKCMTLTGYFALNFVFAPVWLAETVRLRKIIAWKLIKTDTYCQQCKSSAWTL